MLGEFLTVIWLVLAQPAQGSLIKMHIEEFHNWVEPFLERYNQVHDQPEVKYDNKLRSDCERALGDIHGLITHVGQCDAALYHHDPDNLESETMDRLGCNKLFGHVKAGHTLTKEEEKMTLDYRRRKLEASLSNLMFHIEKAKHESGLKSQHGSEL